MCDESSSFIEALDRELEAEYKDKYRRTNKPSQFPMQPLSALSEIHLSFTASSISVHDTPKSHAHDTPKSHGHDTPESHAHSKAKSHSLDNAKSAGQDNAQSDGQDHGKSHAQDNTQSHGQDHAKSHAQDNAKSLARDALVALRGFLRDKPTLSTQDHGEMAKILQDYDTSWFEALHLALQESQISGKMLEESIQTSIKTYAKQYAGQTNRQVYKHAFHDLVMKPHPEGGDFAFFGNTQRAQFADALKKIVASIPSGAHIWDVGAGAGDVVPLFSGLDNVTMHLEEPNQHLLETYKGAVEAASNLTLGKVYQGPLQDFYEQPSKVEQYVPPPVNLVLAIHMIYFLNDYTKDDIAPLESLKAAMGCLYQRLQKGGRIFIVYAGPNNYAIPITLHYFKTHQPDKPYSKNLEAILAAWKELFEDSGLVGHLNQLCPDDAASVKAEHLPCHFFAKDKLDLAAMGAITNLIPSDDEPFDVMRMESCCEWVEKHGAECGLAIEEGDVPQKGCWKINVNQVVVEITKQ